MMGRPVEKNPLRPGASFRLRDEEAALLDTAAMSAERRLLRKTSRNDFSKTASIKEAGVELGVDPVEWMERWRKAQKQTQPDPPKPRRKP